MKSKSKLYFMVTRGCDKPSATMRTMLLLSNLPPNTELVCLNESRKEDVYENLILRQRNRKDDEVY